MAKRHWLLVLLLAVSSARSASSLEEMGLMTWGMLGSCKFRRALDRSVCCTDLHCPPATCCHLYLLREGYSAVGKCLPRDPNTALCLRRKTCLRQADCGRGQCCRQGWKGSRVGVCDTLGQHGQECSTRPLFSQWLPAACPCASGNACISSTGNMWTGRCVSRTITTTRLTTPRITTTSSTTPTPTTTRTTTTRTSSSTTDQTLSSTTSLPETTTAATTTPGEITTADPCASCRNSDFTCCLDNMCRIRPGPGDACGAGRCPCRGSVCSLPDSPLNQGTCSPN